MLALEGAAVGVNFNTNAQAAEHVVRDIQAAGGRALAVQANVVDSAQVDAMVRKTQSELGPIDTLVLNASIAFPVAPFLDYAWEDFERKLTSELRAAFFCCKAVAPGMVERGSGCIIAVSSGLSRHPGQGFVAHSSAKSALDAFVKSLALELGPRGIRVNAVAPGLTDTDAVSWMPAERKQAVARMTPLGRIGEPDDVAGAVLMLASSQARFVTGVYVPVSGGMQMI
jgi:3-oxoacyl-[acyl-carrier protein] reductase